MILSDPLKRGELCLLRNHLRGDSPEVAIRNHFVGINLATIVASFNRKISKIQTQRKHFRIWYLVHKWGDKIPPTLKSDTIEATGWIKRDKSLGGGEMGRRLENVFLGICSIWCQGEEEGRISRWNCLSYTRHVTYYLIGQTNASIEFVPGTSQPQRNITCVPLLDINYTRSSHWEGKCCR